MSFRTQHQHRGFHVLRGVISTATGPLPDSKGAVQRLLGDKEPDRHDEQAEHRVGPWKDCPET